MRITNVTAGSRYFSYASSSGKTLGSGQSSQELPIETAFHPSLKADLAADRIRLRLGTTDREFLSWLIHEDEKEIKVKAPPPPAPKPVKKIAEFIHPAKLIAEKAKAKDKDEEAPKAIFVVPGQAKSLQDLKAHNRGVKAPKRAVVPGIKVDPDQVTGCPNFGQPPTMTNKEQVENAKQVLGGII